MYDKREFIGVCLPYGRCITSLGLNKDDYNLQTQSRKSTDTVCAS